jgi:hypothetical protein
VVEPDRRGDVRGQITHTLDDLRAVQSGQDGAQLSGDRGLEREQLLCVIFAGAVAVERIVGGHHLLGELQVGVEQRLSGMPD